MAGLPHHVSALASHDSISFLRRAVHQHLGLIREEDVAFALRETVQNAGKTIDDEALQLAVEPIGGFPFMMQQGVIVEPDRGIVCFFMRQLTRISRILNPRLRHNRRAAFSL